MSTTTYPDFGENQAFVEELFLKYCNNPTSVSEEWRAYFGALPQEQLPQLTSPGFLRAPVQVPAAAPTNGNGAHANGVAKQAAPARAAAPAPAAAKSSNGTNGHGTNGHGSYPHIIGGDDSTEVSTAAFLPDDSSFPFMADGADGQRSESFPRSKEVMTAAMLQGRVSALVNAFRVRGHLFAHLDPLGLEVPPPDEILLERYGLDHVEPDTLFSTGDMAGPKVATLAQIIERLTETYNRTIGVEFTFIDDREERTWLQHRMESTSNRIELTEAEQLRILTKLTDAEIFEQFLHTNYVGAKRFSLEGAESLIPMLDLMVERLGDLGATEVVIGMAHRGRLNVLVNILDKKVHDIFAGFEDKSPERYLGGGDVKYHLGYSKDRTTQSGKNVHITLTFNPSHLEFVNPVVEGRVRAKQDRGGDTTGERVVPILIHGDAAIAGQGIVTETLNLSQLPGYRTGGTIHLVINNQVGFTTQPMDSRSTRYCTDVTRMLRCPVFHVNGEDPEAVAQAVTLAAEFRQRFHKDVVIDVYCYRKYGHNEADEPRFTQPVMYAAVDAKKSVREAYVERLVETGKLTAEQATTISEERRKSLEAALLETRANNHAAQPNSMQGLWAGYRGGADAKTPDVETKVPAIELMELLRAVNTVPADFNVNPKLGRMFRQRIEAAQAGEALDWGTVETLTYATLVNEGHRVRLSGQDSRRGTFSHRHAVVYDSKDGKSFCPLEHISENQARFEVFDSPLSEAGVLGFDFGYSLDSPDALVIWEAQFGDFVNGAQVITDQFIFSSEDKWERLSGLTMLLPHGFEGQGPEHSSARLERFLSQCAEDNIQVCNLTTPAQLFHCLRRQMIRPWRKPLVIMSPKSLLRLPAARSTIKELSEGSFETLIKDTTVKAAKARRIVLCSGKVYYDLVKEREDQGVDDVAIVRVEQLYPLRAGDWKKLLKPYKEDVDIVWVQEEPWNMGAWFFIQARLPAIIGEKRKLRCISREESASPATGSRASHLFEQDQILKAALK